MPEFAIISVKEAKLRTIPGRQGKFINEDAGYIQQLSKGQAGKLHLSEQEKPGSIRRRLAQAAQALGTSLVIKRSGEDLYFWSEGREDEQPRSKRSYTRRRRHQEETVTPELSLIERGVP
jgi:hypothetical protein